MKYKVILYGWDVLDILKKIDQQNCQLLHVYQLCLVSVKSDLVQSADEPLIHYDLA